MQLFQFFIALMLFTACSSSDNASEASGKSDVAKTKAGKKITIPETFVSGDPKSHSNLESTKADATGNQNTGVEENRTAAVAVPVIPVPPSAVETPSELTALEEENPSLTPPVSALNEETVPLDLTEDQGLVFLIKQSYSAYNNLQSTWANNASFLLELVDQEANNPEFIQPILTAQSLINNMPVTLSEITQIEETLSEDGVFTDQANRESAEEMYKELDSYIKLLDSSLHVSLLHLHISSPQSAEENPEEMYAETDNNEVPPAEEKAAEVVETPAVNAETQNPQPPSETPTVVSTDANNTAEITTPPPAQEDPATANLQPPKDQAPLNTPAAVPPPSENNVAVEPSTPDENPNVAGNTSPDENTGVAGDPPPDESPDPSSSEVASQNNTNTLPPEQNVDEEDASSTPKETADNNTTPQEEAPQNAVDDLALSDSAKPKEGKEVIDALDESFADSVSNFFSGIGNWFDKTTTSLASQFKSTFNTGWIMEPTSLHIPNTVNIAPEQKEESGDGKSSDNLSEDVPKQAVAEAISDLLMNVFKLVQMNDIQNIEALSSYLVDTSPEQRTEDETTLLNASHQIAQNLMNQTEGLNVSEFIKSSGYTSNNLSQEEIIRIIEILADFSKTRKEQPEELAVATPE